MLKNKNLQGGLMLCKSFSPKPFWVIFGNVKQAKFMLDENEYIYRDKRGYGFLLIPTMTIGNENKFGGLNHNEFMERCWNMGLREHPNYFFALIYGLPLAKFDEASRNKVAEDFKDLYTKDELLARFGYTFRKCETSYRWGWYYDKKQNLFVSSNSNDFQIKGKIQVLNILIAALGIKNEEEFKKNLAEGIKLNEEFTK